MDYDKSLISQTVGSSSREELGVNLLMLFLTHALVRLMVSQLMPGSGAERKCKKP
jgi:hypothetical protein